MSNISALQVEMQRQQQTLDSVLASLQNIERSVSILLSELKVDNTNQLPAEQRLPAWQAEESSEASKLLSPAKVRLIKVGQANTSDLVAKLRASKIGRLYIDHLKQTFVRSIVIWVWRNGYGPYLRFTSLVGNQKGKRWRSLITLSEFTQNNDLKTIQLAPAEVVETPMPQVFPDGDQDYLVSPHERYTFPSIYVSTVNNAKVFGGTNLTMTQEVVICHDLFDCERDFTSEELHGRSVIDTKRKRMRWLLHDATPETIAVAASFVDACAANYAHWLTEVLPRIAAFCSDKQFDDVPIIVNEGLHKNIYASLFLIVGANREIILLPVGRALMVNVLYITSVAGYVPFERRKTKLSDHSHGMFSPWAFNLIRNKALSFVAKLPNQSLPQKIYLRRNSGARKVSNSAEIESLLVSEGYVIVDPEKLNFPTQLQLFSHAETIVGSSGAALANMIFCPAKTELYIFISKYPDTSYWYWQNMAIASGKPIRYFLGDVQDDNSIGIHNDFYISADEVQKTLATGSEL